MKRFGVLAWIAALVLALATLLLGAGTGRAQAGARTPSCVLLCPPPTTAPPTTTTVPPTTTTTVPPTTTTTVPPTTTTTVASGAPPIGAITQPCSAPRAGAPCSAEPAQLQVTYSRTLTISGVQLSWVPETGRPSNAPSPDHASVVLAVSAAKACASKPSVPSGSVLTCWAWPSAIRFTRSSQAWTLNGTYQVTACSASTTSNPCVRSAAYSPGRVGIAAPPSPPSRVIATQQYGGMVSVQWSPAANAEPDLTGYSVSRGTRTIYTCSIDGAGPGARTPCPSPLATADSPPSGQPTYSVQALRFGATATQFVLSSPRSSKLGSTTSTVTGGAGGGGTISFNLPDAPAVGTVSTLPLVTPPAGRAPAPATALPGTSGTDLPYDNGALATSASASGSHQDAIATETAPRNPNLDSLASVAAGMILLALAVHIWYLRGQMAGAAARVAARRRAAAGRT